MTLTLLFQFAEPCSVSRDVSFVLRARTTPNEPYYDEWAKADYVFFPTTISEEYIKINGEIYKIEIIGFSKDQGATKLSRFHVREGDQDQADLYAWITKVSPRAKPERIEVVGADKIPIEFWAHYVCKAHYTDGTTRDVTPAAEWKTDCKDVKLENNQILTHKETEAQKCFIEAMYQGLSSKKKILLCSLPYAPLGLNKKFDVSSKEDEIRKLWKKQEELERQLRDLKSKKEDLDDPKFRKKLEEKYKKFLRELNELKNKLKSKLENSENRRREIEREYSNRIKNAKVGTLLNMQESIKKSMG